MATQTLERIVTEDRDELFSALTRIEQRQREHGDRLDTIDGKLAEINGSVRKHDQELFGADGRSGIARSIRRLWERSEEAIRHADRSEGAAGARGVTLRTVWTAVAALAAVGGVIVALVVGLA